MLRKANTVVLYYVYDLLIMGGEEDAISHVNVSPARKLKTKGFRRVPHFLGMDLVRNRDGTLLLRQQKLMRTLMDGTNMSDCEPIVSPSSP